MRFRAASARRDSIVSRSPQFRQVSIHPVARMETQWLD
jgi:hypothetical protein